MQLGETYLAREPSQSITVLQPPPEGSHHLYCSKNNPGAAKLAREVAQVSRRLAVALAPTLHGRTPA